MPGGCRRLYLEAHDNAQRAKWTPLILIALVSFVELENNLSDGTKLEVILAVLSHSAVTPNLRARCERIRDGIVPALTKQQVEHARQSATKKSPEAWAQELMK
jgi:hypothetical protein